MQALLARLTTARRIISASGPYLLLEILLPGGTLLALLLFLYRRRGSRLARWLGPLAAPHARILRSVTSGLVAPLDAYHWARRIEPRCARRPDDGLEALAFTPPCSPRSAVAGALRGTLAMH